MADNHLFRSAIECWDLFLYVILHSDKQQPVALWQSGFRVVTSSAGYPLSYIPPVRHPVGMPHRIRFCKRCSCRSNRLLKECFCSCAPGWQYLSVARPAPQVAPLLLLGGTGCFPYRSCLPYPIEIPLWHTLFRDLCMFPDTRRCRLPSVPCIPFFVLPYKCCSTPRRRL